MSSAIQWQRHQLIALLKPTRQLGLWAAVDNI